MKASDAIHRIEQTIQTETAQIASSFTEDTANNIDGRLACLELTRALNYALWRVSQTKSEGDSRLCTTMVRGFNTAMSLFMTNGINKEGVPNAPSTPESKEWADTVLTQLGTLRLARRVIELAHAGLIEFVSGTHDRLCFRTVADSGMAEDGDIGALRWMSDFAVSQDEAEYRDLQSNWPQIQNLLRANVRVFEKHYIGYDTIPALDEYFHRLAVLHGRRSHGHEAFGADAQFGGLPYAAFGATATTLVGWSLKHMAFATELAAMMPQLDIRNLLVPWAPLQSKAEFLSAALEINEAAAAQILNLLKGTPDLFTRYSSIHDSPVMPFIPAAGEFVHFSMAGAQLLPYHLMLRRLREEYPSDYFRNVNEREVHFRENLRWVLPIRRTFFASKPILLRHNGKNVTDIDALVLTKETGTLGLFQLKWQDPFGSDLRERRNRLTNMVPAANKWIQSVLGWLDVYGAKAMIDIAQFQDSVPQVQRVLLFVVGRYHCSFSGAKADPRATWCSWGELLKAIDAHGIVEDPVVSLESTIRRQRSEPRAARDNCAGVLRLRDFVIEICYDANTASPTE